MSKRRVDLTGEIFGRWKVIKLDYVDERRRSHWLCQCICGTIRSVIRNSLTGGASTSCGCFHKEMVAEMGRSRFEDLTGITFGRLTVIKLDRIKNKVTYWLCNCSCDEQNIVSVCAGSLKGGNTTSCGCYSREKKAERTAVDMIGLKFGKLVVIERRDDYVSPQGEHQLMFLCQCDCGGYIVTRGLSLRNGDTKSCGCLRESYVASCVKEYFIENYNAIPEHKGFKNPDTNSWLFYDVYIPNGIFIEVNGEQHYEYKEHWHGSYDVFEYNQYRDQLKKEFAEEHGTFIEIDLRKIKTTKQAIEFINSRL